MNTTFLAIATPFLVIGLFFGVGGGLMVASTFLSLGLVFLALGLVLGRGSDGGAGHDDPEQPTE